MSSALAAVERPAERPVVTSDELELVRKTVANGATDAELKLYLFDCQRRGVHPLDRLLHFTKRGGRYTPVTSIDFMRSQAAMTGEMAGSDDPVFSMSDVRASSHPDAATVTVYRLTQGQRFAYTATARWAEYCPENAPMWKRMPHTMLGKCAEALALRKAFPQQLAGLYTTDEMAQADNGTSEPAVVVDTTTGEELPAEPAGFEAWWTDFQATADNGLEALEAAWKTSKAEFKTYASRHKRTVIADLKKKAATVAAS